MRNENKLKTTDLVKYLEFHIEYLDDWTLKFLNDVKETLENQINISKKQYQVLIKKSKDVFIEINYKKFLGAIVMED